MKQVSTWIKETHGFESEEMEFVVNFATVVKKLEGVTRKWKSTSCHNFNPLVTVTCPRPLSEFIQVLPFPEAGEESRNWNFLGERFGVDSTRLSESREQGTEVLWTSLPCSFRRHNNASFSSFVKVAH